MIGFDGFGVVAMPLAIAIVVALLAVAWSAGRLTVLLRKPGALQCSLRVSGNPVWKTGVLVLGASELQWYGTRSFVPVPQRIFHRSGFRIVGHVDAPNNLTVTQVEYGGCQFELAMSMMCFAGLVSWIDSAPPAEEPTFMP